MLFESLLDIQSTHGAKCFMETAQGSYSFDKLVSASNSLAETLRDSDIEAGGVLIQVMENGFSFAVSVIAAAKLGMVIAPLNPGFGQDEALKYCRDAKPQRILASRKTESLCRELSDVLGVPMQVVDYSEGTAEANMPGTAQGRDGHHEGAFLLQYSSGSTGQPKPVVRTQRNLMSESANFVSTMKIDSQDVILTVVPLFHAHGFSNCLLAALRTGASLHVLDGFLPNRVMDALVNRGVTVYPGVPFMFKILADSPAIEARKLVDLRLAFSAGAPLDHQTFKAFLAKFCVPVRQLYGCTEAGSITINLQDLDDDRWASIGTPMRNVEVTIRNSLGESLGPNQIGELVVESDALANGYPGLVEETSKSFREGRYWTGDLGRLDDNGNIYITGRMTKFVNVGGNKVDPAHVEEVLLHFPKVKEAVVLGVKDARGQEILKAVLVADKDCTAQSVKEWCSSRLASFRVPRIIEFRDEIPKSPLGKVLRKYLDNADAA